MFHGKRCRAGFTLIEMLTAVAVFSLLCLMFLEIVTLVTQATGQSKRRVDALQQATFALDQLESDLASRARRADLPVSFTSNGDGYNNPIFGFYTFRLSYGGTRSLSAVFYRINGGQLQRASLATSWAAGTTSTAVFLPGSLPQPANTDYQTLAPTTVRFQLAFLPAGSTVFSATPPATTGNPLQSVTAVLAAIVVLDNVPTGTVSSSQDQSLAQALPEVSPPTSGPMDIANSWNALVGTASFCPSVSRPVAQGVRVTQRLIPLD